MSNPNPEPCRCNTERQNPNCHIDHTLSILEANLAFPQRGQSSNPMNSRCGLEDCDCGYVIEKLMETLNVVRGILPASGSIGSDYLHLIGNMGRDIIDEGLKEAAK